MRKLALYLAYIFGLILIQGCHAFSDEAAFHGGTGVPLMEPGIGEPGDKYDAVGTQPFVVASADPLSTFAADVDTASYDIFRRDVESYGVLPVPASVRLEEYVNSFDYDLEAPDWGDEHPFSITVEGARSPFAHTTLMRIGIQGVEVPKAEKKPANIVFMVDISGSMGSHDKLPLAKLVISEALNSLSPTDTVAIVTYAGHESVALVPTKAANKSKILKVIESLDASGSTAGQKGLALAYDQAEVGFIEGGVNHIIMCTDGDFNVGISDTNALVDFIREKRETGVTFTALGFGAGNLNDHMMESVSNAGNGFYSVISSQDQAVDYAANSLWDTANLIARDVKIQVQFNPEFVSAYRLLGYENRAIADHDFENDKVDAGELGSGHRVTALYELVLAGENIPQPELAPQPLTDETTVENLPIIGSMVEVRVRYKEVMASDETPALELKRGLRSEQILGRLDQGSPDLQWAAAIAAFAEILKQSPFASPSNLSVIEELVAMNTEGKSDRLEFQTLFLKASGLLQGPNLL